MTIASTQNRESYAGNGATTTFGFPYPFFAAADLLVLLVAGDGTVTSGVLNGGGATGYTLSGAQDPATGEYLSGASVVFGTAPATGITVVLLRAVAQAQPLALFDNAKFPAKSVEAAFDRATLLAQDLGFGVARCLAAPQDEAPSFTLPPAPARANTLLVFDANGNAAVESRSDFAVYLATFQLPQGTTGTGSLVLANGASLASPIVTGLVLTDGKIGNGASFWTLPAAAPATIASTTLPETFTHKSLDASANTITNLTTAMFAAGVVDGDIAMSANSSTRLATQSAARGFASNASNLASGTVAGARLPFPGVSALGGVLAKGATAHLFVTGISSIDGSVLTAQPAIADLSDGHTGTGAAVCASGPTVSGLVLSDNKISNGAANIAFPPGPTTLLGIDGPQTVTGKTFDTAANTFKAAGTAIAGVLGSGANLVLASALTGSGANVCAAGATLSGVILSDNKISNGANDIAFPPGPATLMSVNGAQSPTNKSLDASANTITNLKSSMCASGDGWVQPNLLINGHFEIWQAGTSFAPAGATPTFIADHWKAYSGAGSRTWSRQSGFLGANWCLRSQRNSANASLMALRQTYQMPSNEVTPLQGKTVTLSLALRCGADYSGGNVSVAVYTGTGSDEVFDPSGKTFATGNVGGAVLTTAVTTAGTRYASASFTVPSNATELAVLIEWTPSGTAATNDYLEIGSVKLELGSVATAFVVPLPQEVLAQCQRQYQKSFEGGTAPASAVGLGTGEVLMPALAAMTGTNRLPRVTFPVSMRAAPTITLYNPANANAHAYDETALGDCSGETASNVTTKGFNLAVNGNVVTAAGNWLGVHYTADARL